MRIENEERDVTCQLVEINLRRKIFKMVRGSPSWIFDSMSQKAAHCAAGAQTGVGAVREEGAKKRRGGAALHFRAGTRVSHSAFGKTRTPRRVKASIPPPIITGVP